ncbi:MAG: pyridoxal 5'-phosphate synthase glutaminase subunit PdxT [Acidimicrobiia bacterium]|nr:pyridoxal 5'-phosphate synthase glutaminase subunit PdxT [Acidimicrobiia bacterium]
MLIGVLALQGDFREHAAMVRSIGHEATEVRTVDELDGIDALILPGGESTTIGMLAERYGLVEPLREAIRAGLPTLGTCAGMIFLGSSTAVDSDQIQLGVLDVVVERNAFGRQVDSFEEHIEIAGLQEPMEAVFIRAPWIQKAANDVEILAEWNGHPVMVRQGNIIATAFHPELTTDTRVHRMFLEGA